MLSMRLGSPKAAVKKFFSQAVSPRSKSPRSFTFTEGVSKFVKSAKEKVKGTALLLSPIVGGALLASPPARAAAKETQAFIFPDCAGKHKCDGLAVETPPVPSPPFPSRNMEKDAIHTEEIESKCGANLLNATAGAAKEETPNPTPCTKTQSSWNEAEMEAMRAMKRMIAAKVVEKLLRADSVGHLVFTDRKSRGRVYQGGFLACSEKYIRENNITAVVNCARGLDDCFPAWANHELPKVQQMGVDFLNLNWADSSSQTLWRETKYDQLLENVNFIEQRVARGERVLIICAEGKSRSTAATMSYLMAKEGIGCYRALEHVRKSRHIASPNPGFIAQLREFEGSPLFLDTSRGLASIGRTTVVRRPAKIKM